MIDSDQSHPLHLRKIPRTIGDVPDGPLFIPKTIMMASPRVRTRSSMQCVNEPRNWRQLKRFEDGNERRARGGGWLGQNAPGTWAYDLSEAHLWCRRGGHGVRPEWRFLKP